MASIDDAYKLLKYRATKGGFNGNISPDDFNLIFPRAEMRLFNSKYKTYQVNQDNSDSVLAYKTNPLPITIDSAGKYVKPDDVLHIDAIRHSVGGIDVEVTRWADDRLGNKLNSTYDAPSNDFPIYVEYKLYLQFYPVSLATANLVYLQNIVPSKWGYTLVSGRPVYNAGTSIQPKYDDTELDEIIYMALDDIAINMRDAQLDQFSERKIQTNK